MPSPLQVGSIPSARGSLQLPNRTHVPREAQEKESSDSRAPSLIWTCLPHDLYLVPTTGRYSVPSQSLQTSENLPEPSWCPGSAGPQRRSLPGCSAPPVGVTILKVAQGPFP